MKEFLPKSAAKMADCLMKRYGLLTSRWSYDYGVAWRGMEALYAMTGEKKYFDYIKDAMDTFVTDESGAIRDYTLDEFNLDYICNGRQLLYLYKATGDEKYLRAADVLRDQLRRQPRTSDGGFWHKKCYPYQMWLDGLHMSAPFYVEYCLMMEDDAVVGIVVDFLAAGQVLRKHVVVGKTLGRVAARIHHAEKHLRRKHARRGTVGLIGIDVDFVETHAGAHHRRHDEAPDRMFEKFHGISG